ncbi:MAG: hypothetical protein LBD11_00325 [Candidatus Peribacteria bacterium]|jgi:hypothetical protein|nr:hypothetical protein [Candidatus Peribacteria bacterium]
MVSTDVAMPWSEVSIYGFLQQFIKDNALLLANYGVDTRNPYPQLAEFSSNFQSTLEVKDKWSGYFPMVDGRLTAINQEKIHIDGMGLLSDDPTSHPQRVHYGGYVEDPNALYVKGTLGKYKSSQHGITYWTLITVDKAGKKYLLATQAIGEMPTSPNFTIEAGQRVIEDYLAHF